MIKLVVKKLIKENKVEEAIKLYVELVELTRKEKGCIKYELYQDEKNFRILTIMEEWDSKDVLDKHKISAYFTRIVPIIGELTEKKLDMNIYNKLI